MSTAEFDNMARVWARDLEDREANRLSISLIEARRRISNRTKVPVGVLEALRRERTKGIRAWVYERLRGAVIAEIQREIERCSHELEMARQAGLDPRCSEMAALESAVARAEIIMRGEAS